MFNIIRFQGGLGNQMFIYAFYLSLKHKSFFSLCNIDPLDSWFVHGGIKIHEIFSNINIYSYKFYRRQRKFYASKYLVPTTSYIREKHELYGVYNKSYFLPCSIVNIYEGFWQSEQYFKGVEKKIRKAFDFELKKLNQKSKEILINIITTNSVSIHIRRCDYLEHESFCDICNVRYYIEATNYIKQKIDNVIFYVFSDDIPWVKGNLDIENIQYIDWNQGKDSWQDMCLMANCKHNIIANSTFSWWGAWLNKNKNKIVVSPNKWNNKKSFSDIIPENWVKI